MKPKEMKYLLEWDLDEGSITYQFADDVYSTIAAVIKETAEEEWQNYRISKNQKHYYVKYNNGVVIITSIPRAREDEYEE